MTPKGKTGFLLLFISLILFGSTLLAEGIRFEEGKWDDILAKARKENKFVFLDAYTTWCGPCKKMAREVFPDASVGKFYNANFVCAKMDMEQGEGIRLAEKYKVEAYPSLFFINSKGEMVHTALGYRNVDNFLALGKEALDPAKQISVVMKKFEAGERSPEFLYLYIQRLTDAGLDIAIPLKEWFKLQPDAALLERKNWSLIRDNVYDKDSREFTYLFANRASFAKLYTSDSVNAKIIDVFFGSLIRAARNDKTTKSYEALKTEIANSGFEKAEKVNLMADMEVYKLRQEWPKYASTAIKYYHKFPTKNAEELNNEAWAFYEKIDDRKQLKEALAWSKKAIEINPNFSYLDTYASLHYKLGNKKEALKFANQAIEAAKTTGQDASATYQLLGKIREMK